MSFTPDSLHQQPRSFGDPNLHLIICYDNKSSLYLRASVLCLVRRTRGSTYSQVLMENLQWRDVIYPSSRGLS